MKNKNSDLKKIFYALIIGLMIIVISLIIPEQTFAQPGMPNNPEQTPIDGGLGILAAFGGVYAIKKLCKKE